MKQVGEQTWQITADKDTTTSGAQTGTKKDAKVGKDDKVQLIAGENLTVNQNERDFTYSLNKDLVKMNSATFENMVKQLLLQVIALRKLMVLRQIDHSW